MTARITAVPVPTKAQALRIAAFWARGSDTPIVGAPNPTDAVLIRNKWIASTTKFSRAGRSSDWYAVTPHGLMVLGGFLFSGGGCK